MMDGGVIPAGVDVVDSSGERMGSVVAATDDFIVVEHGLFFQTDCYVPRGAIARVEAGVVHLTMTKAAVTEQGWEVRREQEEPEIEPAMPAP